MAWWISVGYWVELCDLSVQELNLDIGSLLVFKATE